MYKMSASVFFILMLSIFSANAITATEMINERIKTITSSSELMDLIQQLPPLTPEEEETANQFIETARAHNDSCSDPSCYTKCMLYVSAATCCNEQICIGGYCDFGECIGNPSRTNALASLVCGIRCIF